VAFAEWDGRSMGTICTIDIKGDSITVIWGDVDLLDPEEKEPYPMVQGILKKHKSGAWIISESAGDENAPEIGGCSDGPYVIELKNRKFWTC
jgi:hypothetical protein